MNYVWRFVTVIFVILAVGYHVRELLNLFDMVRHPIDSSRAMTFGMMRGLTDGFSMATPLLLYGTLALAGLFIVGAALLAIPVLIGLFRKRFVVFISYHHERRQELEAIRAAIVAMGARARFVEYLTAADHDLLLDDIQKQIIAAQVVVCLPGRQSSFLDAEVFAAIGLKKFLIFIVDYPHGSLPNTAQKSFPVLRQKLSEKYRYAALSDLLVYLQGRPWAVLRSYVLPVTPHPLFAKVLTWILSSLVAVVALTMVGAFFYGMTIYIFGSSMEVRSYSSAASWAFVVAMLLAVLVCLVLVGLCVFLLTGLTAIFLRLRLLRVFKREIREGQYVFQTIRRALGDGIWLQFIEREGQFKKRLRPSWVRCLLVCVWRNPPFAHHQLIDRTP
jgi:hypothetical protein